MGNIALGLRIKKARQDAGLTQKELGEAIGASRGAVSMWESGSNEPNFQTLQAIARVLGVRYDVLMLGEEEASRRVPASILQKYGGYVSSALDYMDAQIAFQEDIHDPDHDKNVIRLEALHQNPRLGMLFDRQMRLKDSDIEMMLMLADRILNERDGND